MLAPSAAADEAGTQSCPPDVWYKVVSSGASYEAIGSTAGKYNSSSTSAILRYDLTTSKSKETTWGAELGGSVSWGIGQVEAKTKFEITDSTTSGKTVANTINSRTRRRAASIRPPQHAYAAWWSVSVLYRVASRSSLSPSSVRCQPSPRASPAPCVRRRRSARFR